VDTFEMALVTKTLLCTWIFAVLNANQRFEGMVEVGKRKSLGEHIKLTHLCSPLCW